MGCHQYTTASDSTTLESNKSVFPMVAHRSKERATATGPGAFAVDEKGSRLNSGWNVPMAVSCHCRPRCHTRRSKPMISSSALALWVAGMVIRTTASRSVCSTTYSMASSALRRHDVTSVWCSRRH
jgi:hypothetical protein